MPASLRHLTDRRINYYSLLARWKDGLYYSAALIKCDKVNKRCRVCFEDGSEIWVTNKEIHLQLQAEKLTEDEDIVCCMCDDGNSESPNEIILCDVCNQGYHQKCHSPPIDSSILDGSDDTEHHIDWFCTTCSIILNQSTPDKRDSKEAKSRQQEQQQQQQKPQQASTQKQQTTQPSETKSKSSESDSPRKLHGASMNDEVPSSSTKSEAPKASKSQTETAPKNFNSHKSTTNSSQLDANTSGPVSAAPIIPKSQPPKVKQTPTIQQQQQLQQKSTIGPVKAGLGTHQRSAPYYPLSSQMRASAASSASTAALASMTASSALVVGGSSTGRTKQDLVKQSNKSSQRRIGPDDSGSTPTAAVTSSVAVANASISPPKHAVRKSGVNYVVGSDQLVRQSALPTATRSSLSVHDTVVKPVSTTQMQPKSNSTTPSGSNTKYSTTTPIISTAEALRKVIKSNLDISVGLKPCEELTPIRSVVTTAAAAAASGSAGGQPTATISLINPRTSTGATVTATSSSTTNSHGISFDPHRPKTSAVVTVINTSKHLGVIKEPTQSSLVTDQSHRHTESSPSTNKAVVIKPGSGIMISNRDDEMSNNKSSGASLNNNNSNSGTNNTVSSSSSSAKSTSNNDNQPDGINGHNETSSDQCKTSSN